MRVEETDEGTCVECGGDAACRIEFVTSDAEDVVLCGDCAAEVARGLLDLAVEGDA